MNKNFLNISGVVFGSIVAFTSLNAFLYSLKDTQRWDYFFANSFAFNIVWLTWLTIEIQNLNKEKRGNRYSMKRFVLGKKGWIHWVLAALLFVLLFLYLYYKYGGGQQ